MQGRRSDIPLVFGLTLLLAACGSKPPTETPIGNTTAEARHGAAVEVDPDAPLGSLAFATRVSRDGGGPYWIPLTDVAPVVAPPETGLQAGTAYTVVPQRGGAAVELTAGAAVTIKYGCDGNTTALLPLTGEPSTTVAPGLVWVLPPASPAAWTPAGVEMVATAEDTDHRAWTAGPLQIDVTRRDDTHADLTIRHGDRETYRQSVELYFMEGADEAPLDLSQHRSPGIAFPEAVFQFSAGGPYLVVLDTSGYEGVGFQTIFVGDGTGARTRPVNEMTLGLYYCAF